MNLSDAGLEAIKRFEGRSLTAYQDVAGVWTIGYGTTRYRNGDAVRPGDAITADEAEALLRDQVEDYADAVRQLVKVPLTPSQFDALTSWTYNLGAAALRDSTLLKRLNAGEYREAADEMLRWVNAGGRPIEGLRRRREAERAMFLDGYSAPSSADAAGRPSAIQPSKPMAPVLAALLPSIVGMIPELAKLFGSGSAVSDRNIKAAEKVAEVVIAATQAPNLQGAVESMQTDPAARQAASAAVQAAWYELAEAGGGGIDGARKFNVAAAGTPAWRMPAVWVSSALLGLVYMVVGSVLWGAGWSNDIRLQVVTAVLTVIGMVGSFWLGTSASSQRKTDLMAGEK